MWPFEFVAMPTDSPSVSPGGTFNKFGTDVYWISGTFWIVAFCCANAEAAKNARAKTHANAKRHFMGPSRFSVGPTVRIASVRRVDLCFALSRSRLARGLVTAGRSP